ncbi:DUF7261 family protein [Halalkalicoccus jeotgali]|uniref:Uncharacterized protein n=1 Tax=Halalkalicoccus jeotgali (strain DSM 18796 / CECT 7217 / JCM 14584 / KCTC 4019 / B3) TaxID=795797 RepID=D8J4U8_HALJB|nr:hypothetical protein [Halalkalicoccus jeotgali]ADJ15565.1 hypothetical protein HacjB3_10910 [Halalkalicoccus jeotgali B3]ELY36027.1 hypothetical protein C497_11762 [Halalkalicoccus jeotgali B3]
MAALSRPTAERGQLILVTGLTIAVVLVALVVLLNTVIYTENLATRGVDAGGADALEYRAAVVGSVSELIAAENERYYEGNLPVAGVENGTETINRTLSERHLARGAVAETTSEIHEGSPIDWEIESRAFAESGSNATVARNVTDMERFVLTIESVEPATGSEDPFRLVVGDWVLTIAVETTPDTEDARIAIEANGSSWTFARPSNATPVKVDLGNGTIDGREAAFDLPTEPNEIRYENADRVTGSYDFRATGPTTVESVDLAIHYRTAELEYTTETTVQAGESA